MISKMKTKRLPPSVFKIPTDKLRCGYYSDRYFLRTREVLIRDKKKVQVGYQFFPRENAVICGLDEAIAMLKTCAGMYRDENKARRLYLELRQGQWKFQDASTRRQWKQVSHWQRKRTEIRKSLERLWMSGWKQLRVAARFDGDRVRESEAVLKISGDPRFFVHLETALLGVIARPTATATAVRAAGRTPQNSS